MNRSYFLVLAASAIGFAQTPAPPSTRAHAVMITSMNGQSYLGVGLGEIDSERAHKLKLKEEYGVELTHVEEDSPAAKAGLKASDVVLEYNGQRVEGMEQFARFVRETPAGREVKLTISRDGNRQTVIAKVQQRKMTMMRDSMGMAAPSMPTPPAAPPAPGEMPRPFMVWASPRIGIDAEAIEGQLGQFFGVKEGVLIRSIVKGSAAEKAGLRAGDVITKVDGTVVTSPNEVTRALRSARGVKKTFPVSVMREKHETTVNVTIEDSEDRSHFLMWNNDNFEVQPGNFEFPQVFFDAPHFRSIVM